MSVAESSAGRMLLEAALSLTENGTLECGKCFVSVRFQPTEVYICLGVYRSDLPGCDFDAVVVTRPTLTEAVGAFTNLQTDAGEHAISGEGLITLLEQQTAPFLYEKGRCFGVFDFVTQQDTDVPAFYSIQMGDLLDEKQPQLGSESVMFARASREALFQYARMRFQGSLKS